MLDGEVAALLKKKLKQVHRFRGGVSRQGQAYEDPIGKNEDVLVGAAAQARGVLGQRVFKLSNLISRGEIQRVCKTSVRSRENG